MLLEHKEHSCTQKYRKHYSNRGRGRNIDGPQKTLYSHTQMYRTYYSQRGRSRNTAETQRTLMHPEVQKTLFQQREG